ncbi:hypothetical protein CONCODRAFT_11229 [Conidiobolus coronatus NRRL 28638]|uniref:Uncharacterized protein n=1 Tax=Conidiobolus coronatus (strain ATCC 28846 / CBS 209.66 / NRRL 28638) TaxID=796925 RepID=A0A137NW27_CONC2|nr:hypothetical protein CONCODRAFT_11229 [Conidiobolus coronatus NRRL 28638]|eukprot:KXN66839.1 hypothetical protein CONCODRAFT_11229 [Conidiobolus coronatus NRRL 28638]
MPVTEVIPNPPPNQDDSPQQQPQPRPTPSPQDNRPTPSQNQNNPRPTPDSPRQDNNPPRNQPSQQQRPGQSQPGRPQQSSSQNGGQSQSQGQTGTQDQQLGDDVHQDIPSGTLAPSTPKSSTEGDTSKTAIISASVAGSLLVISGLAFFFYRRYKRQSMWKDEEAVKNGGGDIFKNTLERIYYIDKVALKWITTEIFFNFRNYETDHYPKNTIYFKI